VNPLPLSAFIRPGIVHFMAFPACLKGEGPILETLDHLLAETRLEVIELGWIKDRAVLADARARCATAAVEIAAAAQPRLLVQQLDLNHPDAAERDRAVDEMKRAVDDAVALGSRSIAFLSGAWRGEADLPGALDRLHASVAEIAAHAPADLALTMEIFDRHVDKKRLLGPAPECAAFAARVRADVPRFGLMADLSHLPLLDETPAQGLRPVAPHLAHIHIGNAFTAERADPAWGDQHPRFGYPGSFNGTAELTVFLQELFNVGYLDATGARRAVVSFEVKPVGAENSGLLVAGSFRTLDAAWRGVRLPA
jgi:sugar phosphate isomerase/epimerase